MNFQVGGLTFEVGVWGATEQKTDIRDGYWSKRSRDGYREAYESAFSSFGLLHKGGFAQQARRPVGLHPNPTSDRRGVFRQSRPEN